MQIFVYLPFVACIIGVVSVRAWARRADPRSSARILVASGAALCATTTAALALLAFTVVARVPLVAAHGHWAASAVGRRDPVPTWLGVLATLFLVAMAVNVFRVLRDYGDDLGDAIRLQLDNAGRVVTVNDPLPFAYACRPWPFRPGVIIISDGLKETLDDEERAAVLEHERSHLRHHHSVYELLGMLIGALNPLLRDLRREISFSLERWADEDAAVAQGRYVAATALAASAMRSVHSTVHPALAHAGSDIPARVHALLDAPRPRNRMLFLATTANTLIATAAVLLAAHSTELIFEALRR